MKNFTEAPVSVTYTVISPKGFPLLVTMRGEALDLDAVINAENQMLDKGFKPQQPRTFGGQKQTKEPETVEGRICPKCKEKLIYFEAKGKKHIKCSSSKYDWKTKKSTGCDFIEWADSQVKTGDINDFPDKVTQPQLNLIKKLQEDGVLDAQLDMSALTKEKATQLIQSVLKKR